MATLPRAVQRQVEQAEALLAQANNPEPPAEAQPAPDLPAAHSAPQVEPTVQATAPIPAPAPPPPSDDVWERKYKTLQGLFNAEVPKLQSQNKELAAKLHDAIERMEKLAQQPAKVETPPAPSMDPKDVEEFGQDLVEMVQRQVRSFLGGVAQKLDATVSDFENRITQLEHAVRGASQTAAVTAEEMFFSKLVSVVPDWEQINADDRFLTWLAEADPVYGQPRQAALTAAQQALDANRVAAVFNAFKALLPSRPKTDPLDKQVSPKTAASAPPTVVEKPVYTQAQIQKFYLDVAQRKYQGREREMQQIEEAINQAIAEGRVR
jgi:hypothetical protein